MPATTPNGAPYPLPTDLIADGATAIQNLALFDDARRYDSGTVVVPNAGTGGTISYRRIGVWVFLNINAVALAIAAGSTTIITDASGLPAEARPSTSLYASAFYGNYTGYVYVGTGGVIQAHAGSGAFVSTSAVVVYPAGQPAGATTAAATIDTSTDSSSDTSTDSSSETNS